MSVEVSPIRADGMSVSFGARHALEDVSFAVPPAAFVGVLGPNGAGKTTLLRALLGAIHHEGSKWLAGRPAYVPQAGAIDTAFPIDALGVVLMGHYPQLGWRRRPGPTHRRRSLEILDQLGLGAEARLPFGALSSGQRQRTLVGRALAQDGDLLLLDEPLTGIDAPSQEVILEALESQRRLGRTILMTTHDLGQAARVCDHLLVLNRTVVAVGPTEEIFRPEVLGRAYGPELMVFDGQVALLDQHAHHTTP